MSVIVGAARKRKRKIHDGAQESKAPLATRESRKSKKMVPIDADGKRWRAGV